MKLEGGHLQRRGIAGVIVALIIFALLFTAGLSLVMYQARANLSSYQTNASYLSAKAAAGQESLAFLANATGGQLTVMVNNTGGIPLSVVGAYVKTPTGVLTGSGVMNLGGSCTSASGPLNLNSGGVGQFVISPSCYSYPGGNSLVYLSLLTSRGNIFTMPYPLSASFLVSSTSVTVTQTITAPGGGGGNSLVLVMSASPIQAFGGNIITDNVTAFNYASTPMVNVTLAPVPPSFTVSGTASLTPQGCSGPYTPPGAAPDPSGTIPAFSGSGTAPHIYFLCTYRAETGPVGGLASFNGQAFGTQGNTTTVYSASVTSNLVQIGGITNALAQGVFSSNFFFFKYSSCISTGSSCRTNVSPMPPASVFALPEGAVISGGSNYYVTFYVELTNNFNTSLPLLSTTMEQLDQSAGGESDWWLVGTNTSMVAGGVISGDNWHCGTHCVYYPNYSGTPSLVAYPTDCNVVNAQNKPTDPACIYLNPGQTVVITLASCGPSSTTWDWGSQAYGNRGYGGSCVSAAPNIGSGGSATAANTVVTFEYKGLVLTEDLAFQGLAFTS